MGKSLAVFRDSCFYSIVFMLKMQNSTGLENNAFECIGDRFEVHVITVLSSRP